MSVLHFFILIHHMYGCPEHAHPAAVQVISSLFWQECDLVFSRFQFFIQSVFWYTDLVITTIQAVFVCFDDPFYRLLR